MKKLVCIYLVLVMVLTGCGKARRLTGGSDKIIEIKDEHNDGNSGDNSVNEIVPADPTPSPIPTPEPSSSPTGGKDENEKAEQIRDTQVNRLRTFVIGDLIFLGAGFYWYPWPMAELAIGACVFMGIVVAEYLGIKSADLIP
jgi:hypothetical protein